MAAPPLSLEGARAALRWPTGQDLLLSVKGVLAVALALLVGFSQNLPNPYWSGLTVYVLLSQPQTGAIRSKGLYRFAGTIVGGWSAIALTAVFGSSVGMLLFTLGLFILGTLYLRLLDRTPANYFWFATSLTAAVVGLLHVQTPDSIFAYGVARMTEISLGVLTMAAVDSVIGPRPQTRAFLDAMRDWRDQAGDWVAAALAPDASDEPPARVERRKALRGVAAKTAVLDAQGVQLPFDVTKTPLRSRDLRLLRLTVARLTIQLTAANIWAEAARGLAGRTPEVAELADQTRRWLAGKPVLEGDDISAHAAEGDALAARLDAAAARLIADGAQDQAVRGAALLRLGELVATWSLQDRLLHAMATGEPPPPALRQAARRARPARSVDYLATALDILPLVLCFVGVGVLWYMTAWTAGVSAMLFAYVIGAFILGTPGAVKSAVGELVWVCIAFVLALIYQFAVLPQVTAFPVLIAVLALVLIPLGVFMSMSTAGLLVVSNTFAYLGLQSTYAGDFQSSLESLGGALAGCLLAIAALHLCGFDEARFRARRLARAMARDVADAAGARRTADPDRYASLGADRLSLFYTAVEGLPADDPLHGQNLISRFRVGANVLALRAAEPALSPPAREAARRLRRAIAQAYRRRAPPDREALLSEVQGAYAVAVDATPPEPRRQALAALAGLSLAFRPDAAFEARLRSEGA